MLNLTIGNWQFSGKQKIAKGLFSSHYRNTVSGYTASETFAGRENKLIGLTIHDRSGKFVRLVKDTAQLIHQ